MIGLWAVLAVTVAVFPGLARAEVWERVKAFEASGRIDVRLRQGRQGRLEVDTTSRLYPYLQVWWQEGQLLLALRDVPRRWYRRRLRVDVTVDALDVITAKERARIRSRGRIETHRCRLCTYHGAEVELSDLRADTVDAVVCSGSRIRLRGATDRLETRAQSGCLTPVKPPQADLRRLDARTAKVEARDGAKVRCRASERVSALATERGKIRICGQGRTAFTTGCATGGSVRGLH